MATEKETAKKATEEKKKATAPVVEKETAKDPVKEETVPKSELDNILEVIKDRDSEIKEKSDLIEELKAENNLPNKEAINSYYDALKEYFEETGSLPDKELNTAQIYDAVSIERENKQIAEMKRLEEIEANKPKTVAVTDGKQVINVTETTFKYLGKGWKKAPKTPKEVEQLKEKK